MNHESINHAVFKATLFIKAVQALEKRCSDKEYEHLAHGIGTKESGAVRRASMELTRALSEMRRPG